MSEHIGVKNCDPNLFAVMRASDTKPIFTITSDLELVFGDGVHPKEVADRMVEAWSQSMGEWMERRK